MAQETRVAPIEVGNLYTQVLLKQGEDMDLQRKYEQQLRLEEARLDRQTRQEEMVRMYNNAKDLNATLQNQKWQKETTSRFMGSIVDWAKNFKGSSYEYQSQLQEKLSEASQWNNNVSSVYQNLDSFYNALDPQNKSGFDITAFKDKVVKRTLFNLDGTPKSAQQLETEKDRNFMKELIQDEKEKFFSLDKGEENLRRIIKDTESSTISDKELGQTGNIRSGSNLKISYKKPFQTYDPKDGKVKLRTDQNGLVNDDVYQQFISDDNIDALLISKAKNFIQQYNQAPRAARTKLLSQNPTFKKDFIDRDNDGLPDQFSEGDLYDIKKAFLTNRLMVALPENISEGTTNVIINQNNTDKADEFSIDTFSKLDALKPDANGVLSNKDLLTLEISKPLLKILRNQTGINGVNINNFTFVKSGDRYLVKAKDKLINPVTFNTIEPNTDIAIIDKKGFNMVANEPLGQKSKKASQKEEKPSKPTKTGASDL